MGGDDRWGEVSGCLSAPTCCGGSGGLLLVLLVTSFLVFGLLYLAPGSPLAFILGPRGGTPEQIAMVTEQYHLNDPFFARYVGVARRHPAG